MTSLQQQRDALAAVVRELHALAGDGGINSADEVDVREAMVRAGLAVPLGEAWDAPVKLTDLGREALGE